MKQDPRTILATSTMGRLQVTAVIMCFLLTALDGFDVLSISFAAPGIASDWGIDRAALGLVLSMELIGMAFGSILIGTLADRFGRRPAILACLVIMSIGMGLAIFATGIVSMSLYRFGTGLGIGGVLACSAAMAAEFSNQKWRSLSVITMAAGFPLGAIVGGSIASLLLVSFNWSAVFIFGALVTAAFIPLVWFLLPESIEYLLERRPAGALERINHTLKRMGHSTVEELPPIRPQAQSPGFKALFSPGLARTTTLLTMAYFLHIMTFYFTLKWIPKIVVDMGFSPSLAGGVLVWANVGGLAGALTLGLLSLRYGVKWLVIGAMVCGAGMVIWFGQEQTGLVQLSIVAAAAGFFTNSGVVGLYALFAQGFPTEVRAGGTGFAIGFGRGGSAAGPIIAGLLFAAGSGLPMVALYMALGSVIAAALLFRLRPAPPQQEQ
jgi:benzoate transport